MAIELETGLDARLAGAAIKQGQAFDISAVETGDLGNAFKWIVGQLLFDQFTPATRMRLEERLVVQTVINHHFHHAKRQRPISARPRLQVPVTHGGRSRRAGIDSDQLATALARLTQERYRVNVGADGVHTP